MTNLRAPFSALRYFLYTIFFLGCISLYGFSPVFAKITQIENKLVEKKHITSENKMVSLALDRNFYSILSPRIKRNIPGAILAEYSRSQNNTKLVFAQIIFLDDKFEGLSLEQFKTLYEKQMQKTQPKFTITVVDDSELIFHIPIIRGIEQTCRAKLFEQNNKLIQVCGRTVSKDYQWIHEMLQTVEFHI